jgi:hypothetical protein
MKKKIIYNFMLKGITSGMFSSPTTFIFLKYIESTALNLSYNIKNINIILVKIEE